MKNKPVFKPYNQDQLSLLPPSLEELIPAEHLVRIVNGAIEKIEISPLLESYEGGGTSSYHPKMMLKVLVYAYTQKIYSSRQIAKQLRENINFMWLSGNNHPDFRTINRFRGSRLKERVEQVFSQLIFFLIEEGYVSFEKYFLDGTKLEANANKYSWVWKKSTKRYKGNLEKKIKELLKEIDVEVEKENAEYGSEDLEELGTQSEVTEKKIEAAVKKIDETLELEPKNKTLKKARKQITEDYLPRLKKYIEQEEILGKRNSYSKTDKEATFMRMKEDHMMNGQLKAGYNIQMGTEDQFILGWSIHQRAGDTSVMIDHMEKVKKNLGRTPTTIVADAGYGSQENYTYLEREKKETYVKYNTFDLEQKRNFQKKIFRRENFYYDKEKDQFICPTQKPMHYVETQNYKSENGYRTDRRIYQAEDCTNCPVKTECHKGKKNRRIQISFELEKQKEKIKENLLSAEGKFLLNRRSVDVEPVFGHIKQNRSFRRFMLRGIEKVNVEWGLLSFAHNMLKIGALDH